MDSNAQAGARRTTPCTLALGAETALFPRPSFGQSAPPAIKLHIEQNKNKSKRVTYAKTEVGNTRRDAGRGEVEAFRPEPKPKTADGTQGPFCSL